MALEVGWSVAESRGAQAGARIGTVVAGPEAADTEADSEAAATGEVAEAVQSGLAAAPVASRPGLPGRVWRSWLRHWLRYAEVVGAQWR